MGLFTRNTMTIDETVDVTSAVTIMSIRAYLATGDTLSNGQRRDLMENRLSFHGKDASTLHKSKLCVLADDVAKMLISNPTFLRVLDECQWGVRPNSPAESEVNEEITATVRKCLFMRQLV